jgi:hypothetical protein
VFTLVLWLFSRLLLIQYPDPLAGAPCIWDISGSWQERSSLISHGSNWFLGYDVNHVLTLVFRHKSTQIFHIDPHKTLDQLNRLIVVFLSWLRCPLVLHFVLFSLQAWLSPLDGPALLLYSFFFSICVVMSKHRTRQKSCRALGIPFRS